MNAVVGGTAAKKRKKPEIKPQSQIAKCLNEKRRREQENNYIEELAELISAASFAESMNSLAVKPDKCAILQETVNQIRTIKQQETCSDAVQQGEVSSSKPTVITNEVLGPLLLEALEGFLFVVNPDGYVDFCTENIKQFIRYTRQEVLGKSVYNLIHHGDHARFHNCLVPSSHQLNSWSDSGGSGPNSRSPATGPVNRTFNIRLLVKPPDEMEETMEEKQQRVYKYENMQISSTHLSNGLGRASSSDDSGEVSSEVGPCLMCVARRIPPSDKTLSSPIEQFTMKLDRNGTIIGMDTSGVSQSHAQYLNKDLKGRRVQDLCHSQDLAKFQAHISACMSQGMASIALYRLRVNSDRYLHVQTKSKLFRASGGDPDFIMATHSIINDNDVAVVMEASQQTPQQQQQTPALTSGSSGGIGGPMMTGSVNGNQSAPPASSATTYPSFGLMGGPSDNLMEEFDYFPSTTSWGEVTEPWSDRPESRVSDPTPSPLSYPSPAANPPSTPSYNHYPFSPMPHGDEKEESESGRLRSALLQRPSIDSDDSNTSSQGKNKNRILKVLLNTGDSHDRLQDEENKATNNNNTSNNNNNMLLSLLNTKPDDDDKAGGIVKKNQLLSQLLKEDEKSSNSIAGPGSNFHLSNSHGSMQSSLHLNTSYKNILKEISSSPSSPEFLNQAQGRPRKRPSEESDEGNPVAKRPVSILEALPSPSPSSVNSGNSELQRKNKMLASLLAQEPKNANAPVPPISSEIISAIPQEKLPKVAIKSSQAPAGWSGGSMQQQRVQQQGRNQIPISVGKHGISLWDAQYDNHDNEFGRILDEFIDIVPDEIVDTSNPSTVDDLINIFNVTSSSTKHNLPQEQAIRQIQKSLMLLSEEVKTPSYNVNQSRQQQQGSPSALHLHPPSHNLTQTPYPPPPMYQQRPPRFNMTPGNRVGAQQYAMGNQNQLTPQALQQKQKLIAQQKRLLQLQQQQQIVIPPSHQQQSDHNLDSLINTVAPNVSLQRSNSVPDSPSSGYTMLSPVSSSINNNSGGHMSPRSQTNSSYLPSFSNSGGSPFQGAQLSPRVSQSGQQTPNYSQPNSWPSQQTAQVTNSNSQQRLSIQQQQNPMLSAQLTGNSFPVTTAGGTIGYLSKQQQSPQGAPVQRLPSQQPSQLPGVRSLASPSSRHSPFPPELSPSTAASYQQAAQYRLRAQTPNSNLPPGVSLRHYNPMSPHHPVYSPEQAPPYCYDIYNDRGGRLSGPSPTHSSGTNNGVTDYVRQEIRAIVGARQQGPRTPQQITVAPGQSVTAADCEALGLYLEMPTGGSESPKNLWNTLQGGELGVTSPPHRNSNDNSASDQKASLLQKLLSE